MARKKNKLLFLFLKAIISFSLLYLIMRKAGLQEVYLTLRAMNPLYFLSASLLYLLSILFSTLRWKTFLLLEDKTGTLSTFRIFSLYLMGAFFNHILPGMLGGDAVRIYYLYRDTDSSALSLGSVFADRYMGFVALLFLGLMALPFGVARIRGTGAEWAVPLIAISFIAVSLLVFGLRLGKRFATIKGFYEYFLKFRKEPSVLLKAFLLSLIIQTTGILAVYIISVGIGAKASLIEFFLFLPIIITLTTIPISISGLGIREGAFTVLLGLIGIKPEVATSISLAWFLSYMIGSSPGVILYLRWRVKDEAKGYSFHS